MMAACCISDAYFALFRFSPLEIGRQSCGEIELKEAIVKIRKLGNELVDDNNAPRQALTGQPS